MHNQLKAILAGAFILLVALLLLQLCRSNRGEPPGRDGVIRVTLLWDFAGDIDLHVEQPGAPELSFMNMDTSDEGGGVLDVDDRQGGRGSAENAFWEHPNEGHYKVRVVYYRQDDEAPHGGTVRVIVKVNGEVSNFNVPLTHSEQDVTVTEFDYVNPRR